MNNAVTYTFSDYIKCSVLVVFAAFLSLFFIFLSPILLITLFQLAFRTLLGLRKRASLRKQSKSLIALRAPDKATVVAGLDSYS